MKKVMIIEDDPAILDVLAIVFNRAGYMVFPYANGDFIFQGGFHIPDLFIIDKQLSGVDGLDICKHLRSLPPTSQLPIIVFSATPHLETQIKQAGANVFLEKPFNNNDLLQIAKSLINGS
jgi:DNA-binding response OmpR family regulator